MFHSLHNKALKQIPEELFLFSSKKCFFSIEIIKKLKSRHLFKQHFFFPFKKKESVFFNKFILPTQFCLRLSFRLFVFFERYCETIRGNKYGEYLNFHLTLVEFSGIREFYNLIPHTKDTKKLKDLLVRIRERIM